MGRVLPWLLPLLIAASIGESLLHLRIVAAVPEARDQRAAADFVRASFAPGQAIVAAPDWHDPVLRQHLGDLIGHDVAGRSDLARSSGLWVVAVRGARAPEEPQGVAPDVERSFGGVSVRHYPLQRAPITYDFVASLDLGNVRWWSGKGHLARPCKPVDGPPAKGGGLGKAVVGPGRRAVCKPGKPQAFVAPVVVEDLDLRPRHCIWQPVLGNNPVSVTFDDVPLGQRIVMHGGLYYEHERMREGPPVRARVFVDDRPIGELLHRDGDGWKRVELPTGGGRGQVRVEVSSSTSRRRGFCWEATARADGGAR